MSSFSERISIEKLKGALNYEVYAIRTQSYFIKYDLYKAIIDDDIDDTLDLKTRANIDLLVKDGPLLQIQQKTKVK